MRLSGTAIMRLRSYNMTERRCLGCTLHYTAGAPLPEEVFSSLAPSDDATPASTSSSAANTTNTIGLAMAAFDPFGGASHSQQQQQQQPTRVPPSAMHASMTAMAATGNGENVNNSNHNRNHAPPPLSAG
eukprot:9495349-Pyramimonas_sp.AAC.1